MLHVRKSVIPFGGRVCRIADALDRSLDFNQFSVVYQPEYDFYSNDLIGLEALIRWWHPVLGNVAPNEFLPIARYRGLIPEISNFVLSRVLQDMPHLLQRWPNVRVAINSTIQDLSRPDFAERTFARLAIYGDYANHLEYEFPSITESCDRAVLSKQIAQLRSAGVTFAIDNFVTEQSKLSDLLVQPFDKLKLDISMIRSILLPQVQDVAETLAAVSEVSGFQVVAEGIESIEQCQALLKVGCYAMQGNLICRPASLHLDGLSGDLFAHCGGFFGEERSFGLNACAA